MFSRAPSSDSFLHWHRAPGRGLVGVGRRVSLGMINVTATLKSEAALAGDSEGSFARYPTCVEIFPV